VLHELIANFLTEPAAESYLALRQAVLSSPAYQPASDVLYRFSESVRAGQVEQAELHRQRLFPTFLLTPRAHGDYGDLLLLQGDPKGQQLEYYFARQLAEFLMQSGDGSPQRPYQISCVEDEFYILHRLQRRTRGPSVRWFEGRLLDVQHTDSGDVHFDIHPLMQGYPA